MWWGEIYLGITVGTGLFVVWKGSEHILRAAILVLCQWGAYNVLHGGPLWGPATNAVVDLALLTLMISNWRFSRSTIFLSLSVVLAARLSWHFVNAIAGIGAYTYAEINNAIYIVELVCIWVAVLRQVDVTNGGAPSDR